MTATNEKVQAPASYLILSKRCAFGGVGDYVILKLTHGEEVSMTQAGLLQRKARPTVAAEKKGK